MIRERLRRKAGAVLVHRFIRGISAVARLHPQARPERHDVEVLHDVPYLDDGLSEHRLDVYRPTRRAGPFPTVLYIHGGAFRFLSKDTHWIMGLAFARRGYQVFNINYRLAPRHPYPAAVEDSCSALKWLAKHGRAWDADLDRLVLAGESAGANLVTALTLTACWRRSETWAREVFDTGVVPRAVLPACGILQVTDVERFHRRKNLPQFLRDRLAEVRDGYLQGVPAHPQALELADPLLVLERGDPPARPLPPFFASVGTADPILDDTRRLKAAIDKMGGVCEVRYYPGEPHAFHALVFRPNAQRCWDDAFRFLDQHVG
jgi:acetyl esterase